MPKRTSRRSLLQSAGLVVAGSASPGLALLAGCAAPPSPMTETTMQEMTASDALSRIRSGKLSAEAYVGAMLDRAERLKDLNALISVDRAGAIAQARKVDQMRASGAALPALAGLPIVVKDNINSRDLPTTGGSAALRGVRPAANAPTLQKLIDAGAIVIAKANLHELAFGITSTNLTSFAGPVKNPYDTSRIPGGSSGGTAAAIAARIVPAGLGTDRQAARRHPGRQGQAGNAGVASGIGIADEGAEGFDLDAVEHELARAGDRVDRHRRRHRGREHHRLEPVAGEIVGVEALQLRPVDADRVRIAGPHGVALDRAE